MVSQGKKDAEKRELNTANVVSPAIDVVQDSPAAWNWQLVAFYTSAAILGLVLL